MPFIIPNQFVINSHPITKTLIHWYSGAKRDLPWRRTKDPYIVWVSEIILQQTRVDQGLPYFHRFVDSFPSIKDLAKAPEDEVLSNWQGLGYYSRARNMHVTAKYVTSELNGQFPKSYAEILKLKGIGPYTAAAISSICFD
ncbi:MAG: A/G-specific adenine glycosylase, partial [Cyclobacteriaceae bacterium]